MSDEINNIANSLKNLLNKSSNTEKKDENEELISQLAGRYQFDGVEGVQRDLKQINPEKQATITEKLAVSLAELPNSLNSQLDWHTRAAILHELDPKRHSSFIPIIIENVASALRLIEESEFKHDSNRMMSKLFPQPEVSNEYDESDPLIQLNFRLVLLYKLMGVQTLPEGKKLCIEKFNTWEKEFNERSAEDIPNFIEKQVTIAKDKEKNLLRPLMKKCMKYSMDGYADKEEYSKVREKLQEKDGEYYYSSTNFDGRSRTWKVEFYSEGAPLLYFRSVDSEEPGLVFAISILDGFDALENDTKQIDMKADEAVDTYQKEHSKEQQDTLNSYDFPKDRKIVHIRLFPETYDGLVSKALMSSMLLSSTLKSRYGNAFIIRPPLFSDYPEKALRQEMQDVINANNGKPVHFCIDIFSHGSEDNYIFHKPLEAKDIVQLTKDFSQCSNTYNTIACYGAGTIKGTSENKEFTQNEDLRSRLSVFTQSKGDIPNLPANSTAATMYYVHLIQALNSGKSYGEAHRIADLEVKKYLPVDAEAIINGKKLVMNKTTVKQELSA